MEGHLEGRDDLVSYGPLPKEAVHRLYEKTPNMEGTVRFFRQKFTLDDAIGSHACSLEALPCV